MAHEMLRTLPGVSGSVGRLVNRGFKLNGADEDMATTTTILTLIRDEAESVRLSRDQLISYLTSDQKQRIQTTLDRTYQLLDESHKVMNRRFTVPVTGEGGMLRLSDRLVWTFRDKATALNHKNVIEMLHNILLTISIELAIIRTLDVAARPESLNIVGMDGKHTQRLISPVDTNLTAPVATSNLQDGGNYSPLSQLAISQDSKRPFMETAQHLADSSEESADVPLEFSIKMNLKKRFACPAMRTQAIYQPRSIPGDMKRRFSDGKGAGGFVEKLVDIVPGHDRQLGISASV